MNRKVIILVISIIVVLIILSTTTYALFFRKDKLENTESYTAGILDIVIENDEEGLGETLNLTNSLPITDEEGKKSTPYKFKITNKGNLSYTFDLLLNNTTTSNQINADYIKIMVDNNEPVTLSNLENNIIASDLTLNPEESKIISIRIWLDINTPNSEIGKIFSAKIVSDGIGSEVPEIVNLDISKGAINIYEGNSENTLLVSGGGLTLEQEISNKTPIVITGTATDNGTAIGGVTINSGESNITLNNVSITGSDGTFRLLPGSVVNLKIEGENNLKATGGGVTSFETGLYVSYLSKLVIDGTGILNSEGIGCGIGGGDNLAAGSIIINGGTINASSTGYGAGIGGYDLELIEINGGNITATGYDNGSGLEGGAGIGGFRESSVTGIIRINGGTVYAKGGGGAAGIGGGGPTMTSCILATAPNIFISDNANVTAINGGSDAEDIGNGGFSC